MNVLHVRISTMEDIKKKLAQIDRSEDMNDLEDSSSCLNFLNYAEMHKILNPQRLAIVQTLAGNGFLSIREVSRRLGRDVQAVHRDITMLSNAGVIDKTQKGVSFPYDSIHFDFDIKVAA